MSGSIKHEVAENYDALRFGLKGVKGEIVGSHPLETLRESRNRFWEEKKQAGLSLTYGSAFNLRRDLDAQILAKFQRPPGALPSSMIGFEALTGALDDFGFEDYLNVNRRLDEWVKLEQLDLDTVESDIDEKVEDKVFRKFGVEKFDPTNEL